MVEPVRMALLGCGGMGARHAMAYAEMARRGVKSPRLVAVCDEDPERTRQVAELLHQAGIHVRVHAGRESLWRDEEVDGVDIVLPTWLHHGVVPEALDAGLHVLVEKPLGITVRACDRIADAAARSGRIVGVAENYRRMPGNRALGALLASGALGRPLYAISHSVTVSGALSIGALGAAEAAGWYEDRRRVGAGQALELGVHEADLLRYWFGEVDEVMAMTERYRPRPAGLGDHATEDTLLALLRFESGLTAQLAFSAAGAGRDLEQRWIHGSEGSLYSGAWINWDRGDVRFRDGRCLTSAAYTEAYLAGLGTAERERLFPDGTYDPDNLEGDPRVPIRYGVAAEIFDFARAVRTGSQPEITLHDGRRAVAIACAMLESAHARRSVRISDVLSGRERARQAQIDEALGLA